MIALALDTAREFGSLALIADSGVLEEVALHEPAGFSAVLFDRIGELLLRHALRPAQIDLYAAAAGPGSFTGVRIGLTAVKALAEVHAKPCFGVSNLEAMASAGSGGTRAVLLDARRGEIYGAVFGAARDGDATVGPLPAWLAALPDRVDELLAFEFAPFEAALSASRFAQVPRTVVGPWLAARVGAIAIARHRAGEIGDGASLDANYVRRSDAELLWKDR